jgi:hypothetical protein
MTEVHYARELAYLDAFLSGLVPVTVVSVEEEGSGGIAAGPGQGSVTVRVNATRGAYKRGEVIPGNKACNVVPRDHHRYARGHSRINVNYRWSPNRVAEIDSSEFRVANATTQHSV